MRTDLCDLFGIDVPIFAFSHCRDVVAAVTNAGGLGVLGALAFSPEQLELELAWIDDNVDGKPYGVDTVMPMSYAGKDEGLGRADTQTGEVDADVFQNHVGWAPCIRVSKGDSTLFILPGPPREMEALFNGCVAEYISSSYQTKSAVLRVMINMFESEVSPLLETVMENYPTTYLKGYVAMRQSMDHGLPVDIVATGENAADAQLILNAAVELLSNMVSEKGKRMELYDE